MFRNQHYGPRPRPLRVGRVIQPSFLSSSPTSSLVSGSPKQNDEIFDFTDSRLVNPPEENRVNFPLVEAAGAGEWQLQGQGSIWGSGPPVIPHRFSYNPTLHTEKQSYQNPLQPNNQNVPPKLASNPALNTGNHWTTNPSVIFPPALPELVLPFHQPSIHRNKPTQTTHATKPVVPFKQFQTKDDHHSAAFVDLRGAQPHSLGPSSGQNIVRHLPVPRERYTTGHPPVGTLDEDQSYISYKSLPRFARAHTMDLEKVTEKSWSVISRHFYEDPYINRS